MNQNHNHKPHIHNQKIEMVCMIVIYSSEYNIQHAKRNDHINYGNILLIKRKE